VAPAASFHAAGFFFLLRAERNSPTIHKLQRYWHDCCCWTAKAKRRILMKAMQMLAAFVIFAVPVCAQDQHSNLVKLEINAQKVVKIISGDKLKTKTYCEIVDLGEQIDEANQQQDADKAEELSQKINGLQTHLGPEFVALADGLKNVDPNSKDGQEISSILEKLDELCED
jgi:hypothetical protein